MLVSFGTGAVCKGQSFPRKQESSPPTADSWFGGNDCDLRRLPRNETSARERVVPTLGSGLALLAYVLRGFRAAIWSVS